MLEGDARTFRCGVEGRESVWREGGRGGWRGGPGEREDTNLEFKRSYRHGST